MKMNDYLIDLIYVYNMMNFNDSENDQIYQNEKLMSPFWSY
jgi:hypothetical protein